MKQVLFVIDMLNDFVHKNGALYCGPTADLIVAPTKELINNFHMNRNQIYFICDAHEPGDKEFARFTKHGLIGTWGQAVLDGLGLDLTKGDRMLFKSRYNAFYNTSLEMDMLRKGFLAHQTQVVVCGVCTSICVMDTVGWLANMDYDIIVRKDCVADFDPAMHEMALTRMEKLYGAKVI